MSEHSVEPLGAEVDALLPLVRGLGLVERIFSLSCDDRALVSALSRALSEDPDLYPDVVLTTISIGPELGSKNRAHTSFLFESEHVPGEVKAALSAFLDGRPGIPLFEDLLQAAIEAGGDVRRVGTVACHIGAAGVVRGLLAGGRWDVNETPYGPKSSPLRIASDGGHAAVVELLLQAGADKNKGGKDGLAPLLIASENGHRDVVELLLQAGAAKNIKDTDGRTPLYFSASKGRVDVVRLLTEAGADIFKARDDKSTPISVATSEGHMEVCEVLFAGALANTPPDERGFKAIDLRGCGISDASALALVKALRVDPSVTAFDLSKNSIRDAGARALAEALVVNPNLKALILKGNKIGDAGVQALADALMTDAHVFRVLHLGRNRFGDAGRQRLNEALASTICVIDGVEGLDVVELSINVCFASAREEVVKPRIRSLSALVADPTDPILADTIKDILIRTTRALAALPLDAYEIEFYDDAMFR